MTESKVLLVIRGHGADRMKRVRTWATVIVIAVVAGSAFLILHGDVPWLAQYRVSNLSSSVTRALLRVVFAIGIGGAWIAERFLRGSSGLVHFYEDRVVIAKDRSEVGCSTFLLWPTAAYKTHSESVPWGDLRGFRDDRDDFVALVKKEGGSSFLTVPTLSEEDRVAVLRLLDEKGVPRLEG